MILQDYAPKTRPVIRKPIIAITRSTLGTTIVFRSPFSRAWVGNITIAAQLPPIDWGLTVLSGAAILAGATLALIMIASVNMALKSWGGF